MFFLLTFLRPSAPIFELRKARDIRFFWKASKAAKKSHVTLLPEQILKKFFVTQTARVSWKVTTGLFGKKKIPLRFCGHESSVLSRCVCRDCRRSLPAPLATSATTWCGSSSDCPSACVTRSACLTRCSCSITGSLRSITCSIGCGSCATFLRKGPVLYAQNTMQPFAKFSEHANCLPSLWRKKRRRRRRNREKPGN